MGKASQWSLQLRANGEKLGVTFTDDDDKHKRQEVRTKTLGAENTDCSRARPYMQRLPDFVEIIFAILSQPLLQLGEVRPKSVECQRSGRKIMDPRTHQWVLIENAISDDSSKSSEEASDDEDDADGGLGVEGQDLNDDGAAR